MGYYMSDPSRINTSAHVRQLHLTLAFLDHDQDDMRSKRVIIDIQDEKLSASTLTSQEIEELTSTYIFQGLIMNFAADMGKLRIIPTSGALSALNTNLLVS